MLTVKIFLGRKCAVGIAPLYYVITITGILVVFFLFVLVERVYYYYPHICTCSTVPHGLVLLTIVEDAPHIFALRAWFLWRTQDKALSGRGGWSGVFLDLLMRWPYVPVLGGSSPLGSWGV